MIVHRLLFLITDYSYLVQTWFYRYLTSTLTLRRFLASRVVLYFSKTQGAGDANGATHTQNADRYRAKHEHDGTHSPQPNQPNTSVSAARKINQEKETAHSF